MGNIGNRSINIDLNEKFSDIEKWYENKLRKQFKIESESPKWETSPSSKPTGRRKINIPREGSFHIGVLLLPSLPVPATTQDLPPQPTRSHTTSNSCSPINFCSE